jgi:hypothetical protein
VEDLDPHGDAVLDVVAEVAVVGGWVDVVAVVGEWVDVVAVVGGCVDVVAEVAVVVGRVECSVHKKNPKE